MAVRGFAQLRLSGYPPCEKRHGSSCAAAAAAAATAAGSREEAEDDVTERRREELMYTSYIGCPTKANLLRNKSRGFTDSTRALKFSGNTAAGNGSVT